MPEQDSEPTRAQALPRWFEELRPGGTGEGFLERGLRHSLLFVRRPVNRLLVTFDNLSNVRDTAPEREPWAFKFAQDRAIAHLGVLAHSGAWYRDAELIARFEKLASDGFFEGYDRVIFAGVSMGGYAAIAFASLVPGAHVVSINPQSTLDIDLVPWETRYENGRRQDWTLPLSDAAALTGDLGKVQIFYDPYHDLDRQHVARFSGANIHVFHCRYSSHKTAVFMRKTGILKPVMEQAVFGDLTSEDFYRLYRARRNLSWWKNAVSAYFIERGRDEIAEGFGMAFRKRLRGIQRQQAEAREAEDGFDEADLADPGEDALDVAVPETVVPEPVSPEPAMPEIENIVEDQPARVPHTTRPLGERKNDRCAIVTTMKNEGPFMLEWLAYHRSIGFNEFLIYTNDCDDGTDLIAQRLEELGLAYHVDNRFKKGSSPQRVALRRALKHPVYQEADWMICADCDEFLNIRAGDGHLEDLFDAVGEADAVSFCWKLFGCGDQTIYQDRFIHENFVWAAPEEYREKHRARGIKTIFRPSEVIRKIGVHRPKFYERPTGFIWKDAGGHPVPDAFFDQGWMAHREFSHDHARLHHYAVRSADSFLVKRDRGRTNHIDRDQGIEYWADMNLNMTEDRALVSSGDRTRKEFESLMSDEALRDLHEQACAWHQQKIDTLKAQPEWRHFHETLLGINRTGETPPPVFPGLENAAAQ
ncbi:MAG: glycosyltransferase family 2 protein [Pseudomonadota bacterium]